VIEHVDRRPQGSVFHSLWSCGCLVAIVNDTQGSIRSPAGVCIGIVGDEIDAAVLTEGIAPQHQGDCQYWKQQQSELFHFLDPPVGWRPEHWGEGQLRAYTHSQPFVSSLQVPSWLNPPPRLILLE